MSLVLGIDAGTSGIRAYVCGEHIDYIALSTCLLPASRVRGNEAEQRPQDWWQACCQVIDSVLDEQTASRIEAIAIDGTSSTSLLCDEHGVPVGPALMYNDSRARQQAALLARRVATNPVLASSVASPSSSLAKLLWLLENIPAAGKASHFCHQADWLTGHFLDNYCHSDQNNALKLGYDAINEQWPPEIAQLGLPPGLLPRVHRPGEVLGDVSEAMRARFGLSPGCKVIAGTTDSTASCIAAGISQPGDGVTVLGSTLVVKILSEKPVFAPEYGVYSHRLGDYWLVGGASNSGGAVLRHYFSDAQLQSLSAQIDPDQNSGLDYYPLLQPGERFPTNNPDFTPKLSPRPESDVEFLHGLLEGIARIEAGAYEKLQALGAPAVSTIRTIGGGANNPAWRSMRTRLCGVEIIDAQSQQAACGAARLALEYSASKQQNEG